jgi:hypothetical protein
MAYIKVSTRMSSQFDIIEKHFHTKRGFALNILPDYSLTN